MASALSGHLDAKQAATFVARRCKALLAGAWTELSRSEEARSKPKGAHAQSSDGEEPCPPCDLAILFISAQHLDDARLIADVVRAELSPRTLVGVSGESVLGDQTELERQAGVSLVAMSLEHAGVDTRVFRLDELPPARPEHPEDLDEIARIAAFGQPSVSAELPAPPTLHRGTILLVDPFSVALNAVLPTLVAARDRAAGLNTDSSSGKADLRAAEIEASLGPIIGGFASASTRPGGNVLLINDSIFRAGGIGISFVGGNLRIDSLVSQGCRPIGQPMVITAGKQQLITGLAGRPALQVLSELLDSLDEATKEQVRKGLFVGRAVNEYKERFGRDDFVIRNLIGIDQTTGSIAVADLLRVGQTVQFHVRDARTAAEDLALLLDAQQLREPALGALMFTCNGRGTRLFARLNHDAVAVSKALSPPGTEPGPIAAKMGNRTNVKRPAADAAESALPLPSGEIAPTEPGRMLPLAGFFAGGEIGPVGSGSREVFVHGQTACVAIFRAR